jgi:hypothetical protein
MMIVSAGCQSSGEVSRVMSAIAETIRSISGGSNGSRSARSAPACWARTTSSVATGTIFSRALGLVRAAGQQRLL